MLLVPTESNKREWFSQTLPPQSFAASWKITETNGFLATLVGKLGALHFYDVGNGVWDDMTEFVTGDAPGFSPGGLNTAEDGKVYAVKFGQDPTSGPYTDLYVLDPLLLSWTNLSPRVSQLTYPLRSMFGSAILYNHLYIYGGSVEGVGTDHFLVLDLRAQLQMEWQDLTDSATHSGTRPHAIWNHGMAATRSRVYVFGGVSSTLGNVPVNNFHVFDPQARHWHDLSGYPNAPSPRSQVTMTASADLLFLIGGSTTEETLYIFDPSGPAWTQLTPDNTAGPFALSGYDMGLAMHAKQIFVYGGENVGSAGDDDKLLRLDLPSRTWTDLSGVVTGDSPGAADYTTDVLMLRNFAAAAVGERLFVQTDTLHIFEVESRTWVDASSLISGTPPSTAAGYRTAFVAVDNAIYLPGKEGPYWDEQAALYRLDTDTLEWTEVSGSFSGAAPPIVSYQGLVNVGRKLWLYGGWNSPEGSVFALDIDSLVWEDLTPRVSGPPPPGTSDFGIAAINSSVYVFGGPAPVSGALTNGLFALDTDTLVWSEIRALNPPQPRSGNGMLAVGRVLFVFGGTGPPAVPDPACSDCNAMFNELLALDLDAAVLEWKDLTGMIGGQLVPGRHQHAFLATSHMLHVLGGSVESWGLELEPVPDTVFSIYTPQQHPAWPSTHLAWLRVYDWDKINLAPDTTARASHALSLCERMWPCSLDVDGHGGSLAIDAGASLLCKHARGCEQVRLWRVAVACEGPAAEPWLRIEGAAALHVSDSTVAGCEAAGDGGFIAARDGAAVEVRRVRAQARSLGAGGAIYVAAAALDVADSEFVDCAAATYGGAIAGSGTVRVQGSSFERCSAGAEGGAVFVSEGSSDLVVAASAFANCSSEGGGGAIGVMGASMSVEGCKVEGCSTRGSGGAIKVTESNDRLLPTSNIAAVSHSSISNCSAAESGGAISSRGGETQLESVCLRANAGRGGAGGAVRVENAFLRVENTLFRDNAAGEAGGAISGERSELAVTRAWFVGNAAHGLGGGALHLKDSRSALALIASKDNTAAAGGGGLIFWQGADEEEPRMSAVSGARCVGRAGSEVCEAGHAPAAPGSGGPACEACAAGSFKAQRGAGACEACPPRSSAPAGSVSVRNCSCEAGAAGPSGGPCAPCLPGHHAAGVGWQACEPCAAGAFAEAAGASACELCPPGTFHAGNSSEAACAACPDRTHSAAGAAEEAQCVCMPGFTRVEGACAACGAGSFKAERGDGPCASCPAGSYMPDAAATACELCPAGTFAAGGPDSDGQHCEVCPERFASSPRGSTSEAACSVQHTFATCKGLCDCRGFYSATGEIEDGSGAGGLYAANSDCSWIVSSAGATAVTVSLATFELEPLWDTLTVWECMETQCVAPVLLRTLSGSHSNASLAVASRTGVLMLRFRSDASDQHAGFAATWQTTTACPLGSVKGAGPLCVEPSCSNCDAPAPANARFTSCSAALPANAGGAYTAQERALYCHWACDAGWYRAGEACVQCPPDSDSEAGSTSMRNCSCDAGMEALTAAGCSPCSAGTFKAGAGAEDCAVCSAGSFQTEEGATHCELCPAETAHQGTSSEDVCAPCPEGSTSAAGSAVCKCDAGWFQPAGGGACARCEAGTYAEVGTDCLACAAGSFSEAAGASACELCPAGTYQSGPRNERNCSACSAVAPLSGSPAGTAAASGCTPEHYFAPGHCTGVCECRAFYAASGTFEDSPGGDFEKGSVCEWVISAPGAVKLSFVFASYSAGWSESLRIFECRDLACSNPVQKHSVSYWSLAPSYPINSGIARVTFTTSTSSWDSTADGFVGSWSAASECDDDEFMGPGPWCEPPACSNCASPIPANAQPLVCDPDIAANAPAAYTAEQEAALCAWECTRGHFLEGGACVACPAFSDTSGAGSTAVDACTCNAGYEGPAEACVACPLGKARASWQTACTDCDRGRYTPAPAAQSCSACYSNTFLHGMRCFDCPAFASSSYGSSGNESCSCNAGYAGPYDGPCEACGPGLYKEASGDGACVACPAGSFQLGSGASACETCPAGSFHQGSATERNCVACEGPMFTAAPAGSSSPNNCTEDAWFSECAGDCTCGGFWNATGSFEDGSGPWADFKTRSDCTWIVSSPGAVSVSLSFPEFHTHSRYSRMDVSECSDMACSEMVARYNVRGSGVSPETVYKIDTGIMHIHFTHGSYPVTGRGFEGRWTTATECEEGMVKAAGPFCRPMLCSNTPPDQAQFALADDYSGECAWECRAGTFLSNGTCLACPASSTSLAGSVGRAACVCMAGFEGADPDSCAACTPGSFKATPGPEACEACATGAFAAAAGATRCEECAAGSFHAGARSDAECTPCAAHAHAAAGSWAAAQCACNAGYAGPGGDAADGCVACAAGSFKPAPGPAPCESCAAGSFAEAAGASACELCPAGTYQSGPRDTVSCIACPALSSSEPGSTDCMCAAAGGGPAREGIMMACAECQADLFDDEDRAGGCGAGIPGDDCNSALYGNCAASSRKRLELEVAPLAYAGVPLQVVVRKRDFYDQVVLSDSASALQASLVVGESDGAEEDASALLQGSISSVMQRGQASFTFSVKPTFLAWDQRSGETSLYNTPAVRFAGLDAQEGLAMQSPVAVLNFSAGALPVCPSGYFLNLDPPSSLGTPAACSLCRPGTYSIDPLVGNLPPTPSCLACPAGGTCMGGADVRFSSGTWAVADGVWVLESCPRGHSVVPGPNASFSQAQQECRLCAAGEDCALDTCTACQPCQPGRFKSTVGAGACAECPANSFAEVRGASSLEACQPCTKGSSTLGLAGRSSWRACACDPDRYLVEADRLCMVCPVGAKCSDPTETCALGAGVQNLSCPAGAGAVLGAWERRASGEFELVSCPAGHELVKLVDGVFTHNAQQCRPCDPTSHYILDPNAHQCQPCPPGLVCHGNADMEPATPGSTWVADGAVMRLLNCPPGHLLVNSTLDQQYCFRCEALTYSFNPTDGCSDARPPVCGERVCQDCPNGAECKGGDHFSPLAPGSEWETELNPITATHAKRLKSCAPGYIAVRGESAVADTCALCPPGRYSVLRAEVPNTLTVARAENALDLCKPCEVGMNCSLGGSLIAPLQDYWFPSPSPQPSPQRRAADPDPNPAVATYRCAPGACLAGGGCTEGRTGVLCGLCAEGFARAGSSCQTCGSTSPKVYQYVALGVLLPVALVAWWFISWRQAIAPEDPPVVARGVGEDVVHCGALKQVFATVAQVFLDHDVLAYFKIFISFFQITSTFDTTLTIEWPEALRRVWAIGAFLRLQVTDLPAVSCIAADWPYLSVLQAYTITPTLVALMLWIPMALLIVTKHQGPKKLKRVSDRFYFCIMFWAFLIYPNLAIMTLQGLNCVEVAGQHLLAADLRAACPSNNPASLEFLWPLLTTLMFPVAIPVAIFVSLRVAGVPELSRKKMSNATLRQLIQLYRHLSENMIEHKVAAHIKLVAEDGPAHSPSATTEVGASVIFERVAGGRGAVTCQALLTYFAEHGVFSPAENHDGVFSHIFAHFAPADGSGMRWEAFLALAREIVDKGTPMSELVTCDTISPAALEQLVRFRWSDMLDAEDAQESLVRKELRRQIAKAKEGGKRGSVQGLLAEGEDAEAVKGKRRASLILHDAQHAHADDAEAAEISVAATRSEKLALAMEVGAKLLARGSIALPLVGWDHLSPDPAERHALEKFGFLFESYRVEVWYFEILELLRKFLLTGVLVFIYPESPEQIAAGFVITMFFFVLYGKMNPFRQHEVNNMQNISMLTQSITLFYGLMTALQSLNQEPSAGSGDRNTMIFLVCFLHGIIFIVPLDGMFPFVRKTLQDKLGAAWKRVFPPKPRFSEEYVTVFEKAGSAATRLSSAGDASNAASARLVNVHSPRPPAPVEPPAVVVDAQGVNIALSSPPSSVQYSQPSFQPPFQQGPFPQYQQLQYQQSPGMPLGAAGYPTAGGYGSLQAMKPPQAGPSPGQGMLPPPMLPHGAPHEAGMSMPRTFPIAQSGAPSPQVVRW